MPETLTLEPPQSEIAGRLAEPAVTLSPAELSARWFQQTIEIRLPGLAAQAADPSLPGRIRGAWGRELMRAASAEALAGRPCPWSPPCALDVLFREQGRAAAGLPLPRPVTIAARAQGPDLAVQLSLIGFACDWIPAAGEALVAGLRHGDPLRLADRRAGSDRQGGAEGDAPGPAIDRRSLLTREEIAVPPAPAMAELAFFSPLCLRRDGTPAFDGPRMLVSSLGNRLAGLARWHDARLEADWRGLAEAADALQCDAAGLYPVRWLRRSDRQGGRAIPMTGLAGTLVLAGDLAPIAPLLVLGSLTHAGSHAGLGLGGYELTLG